MRLLVIAVTLAVAALTAVGFFADRLNAGLQRDARQLLGGDAVLASDRPTPPQAVAMAQSLGLRTSQSVGFPTMARAPEAQGGGSRLVALKAVADGYPLRGELLIAAAPRQTEEAARGVVPPGEAWVDAPVLESLSLNMGDALLLGDTQLRITRVVVIEPDRGAGFMAFAPRVMINQADLAASGLIQPASRVNYRLAVAGPDAGVREFNRWAEAQVSQGDLRGARLESLQAGRPEMRQTLDRAEKFLNLVALLAALLSAVAVGLAARAFASSHLDDCAMLRVLGQSQRTIAGSYTLEFLWVGLFASALGVALGYAVHYLFVMLLAGLVESAALPPAGPWPAMMGLGVGLTLLVAFGLPPVLQLASVPPLRVIRRDVGQIKPVSVGVLAVGVLGFAALLLATSRDRTLGAIAVGGFAAAVLVFALASWGMLKLLRRVVKETTAPRWLVLATRQLTARPGYAVAQVSALAVGLLALVLLVLLRTDLINSWRAATPPDAPNRFVINVMPEQGTAFKAALTTAGVQSLDWYPMIRGRLIEINGRAIGPEAFTDDRAQRMVDREFNLSHSSQMPEHNRLIGGQWKAEEADGVSVEDGIAKTLGIKLGDTVVFDVAGIRHQSRITSVREVDWGSLRANFFMIFPVSEMPQLPSTYLAAFKAPDQAGFDNALVRQFPNITNVDMTASVAQVQRVLNQVIRAVEFLFAFTLAAGLVVLFAAISATREERARELAVMRAVGAQSALLRQMQRAELIGVGLLAGVLASVAASVVGWALARFAFEFNWALSPWVPLGGALSGAVLALAAGWWGLKEVLQRPVMDSLRRAAQ